MRHHKHLTTFERESIFKYIHQRKGVREIAKLLNRSPSTISREINSNRGRYWYSPSRAEKKYQRKRKNCGPIRKFSDVELKEKVYNLLKQQWSPEQIAKRLAKEGTGSVSYITIYRAINKRVFETEQLSPSMLGIKRQLRHHGKHKKKGIKETRGKRIISHHLSERPEAANTRSEVGHFEADTVVGYMNSGALLTMVDRKNRYTYAELVPNLKTETVNRAMLKIISRVSEIKTITPDRGTEFSAHKEITSLTGIEFYFPPPGQPWKRGTNENTNGLLRQYFPKRKTFAIYTGKDVQDYVDRLNHRPRKILNWLSPFEVANNVVLHLT